MALEVTPTQFAAMNSMIDLAFYALTMAQTIKKYDDAKCNKLIEEAKVLKSSLDDRMNSH